MPEISIEQLVKTISKELSQSSGTRINIAIVDGNANFAYISEDLQSFTGLFKNFIIPNFKYLKIGDYSIPISGKNIMFFKISNNKGIILHTTKGKIGQFLAFRKIILKFHDQLNKLLENMEVIHDEVDVQPKIEKRLNLELIRAKFNYYPKVTKLGKKILNKNKFSLNEVTFISQCNGSKTLYEILESFPIDSRNEILDFFYQMVLNKWVEIPNHYVYLMKCVYCKKERLVAIPKYALDCNYSKILRKQVFPETCPHSFTLKIDDNKDRLLVKKMLFDIEYKDKIDFNNLSFDSITSFFGIELFSHIFYNLIFQKKILFIINSEIEQYYIKALIKYLEKIFINLSFGENIQTITVKDYIQNWKKNQLFSIIDFQSCSIINEPLQDENFETEINIIQDILSEPSEELQIIRALNKYRDLLFLTEKFIQIIQPLKNKISMDKAKILFQNIFQKSISTTELQFIRKLALIHFEEDLIEKIDFPIQTI
ncbi:MAG: hypothetical protein ACTSO9_05400 [Candidatus Helarchaeota archaeon]